MTRSGTEARRQLTYTVVGCAAAAGLALFASSRTWLVETVLRAEPLPPVVTLRSGGSLVAALPALALVGLAGAGGLLATRAWGRRLVAFCVLAAGVGLAALATAQLGRSGVATGWVLITAAGGIVVAATGGFALRRGAAWPGLGARYQRAVRSPANDHRGLSEAPVGGAPDPPPEKAGAGGSADRTDWSDQVDGPSDPTGEIANQALWDAIERGEDPTKS